MIPETKPDESFPTNQFVINSFSAPFRLERNNKGGRFILYIRECIPSKLVLTESSPIKGLFIDIRLRTKKKGLLCCSYNPKKDLITEHLYTLSKSTVAFASKYDKK